MASPLSVTLNGVTRTFPDLGGATADALITELGFRADRVALEINGDIAPRATWASVPLRDGDKIELVHFVGGGSRAAA